MIETAIKYSQIYRFLADAFLYPQENWLEDLPLVSEILDGLEMLSIDIPWMNLDLVSLQELHRQIFGLTGSLCYETEYGLPHEFRQSQELADIAGFYKAFGYKAGGTMRERPDHLAVELEFMHLLCIMEAKALSSGQLEEAHVCQDAQRSFLKDHLGSWIGLFSQAIEINKTNTQFEFERINPYHILSEVTSRFVLRHANRLDVCLELRSLSKITPTPLGPEMSCSDCPLGEGIGSEETCL
jgi:putative dimethyl sulfoxide reductase chaperone